MFNALSDLTAGNSLLKALFSLTRVFSWEE